MAVNAQPPRVHGLWFEDGNIVIQAGNVQFRVYCGLLEARSSVFKEMFSFPRPAVCELVDGCPLVRLPNPAMDVTVFLKALFDHHSGRFFKPYPLQTEFSTILGCLRLGIEYGVDSLRLRALIHLSSRYYTKLSDLDECDEGLAPVTKKASWKLPGVTRKGPSDPWVARIQVIQLAREADAPWILPHAFFDLSCIFSTLAEHDPVVFHDAVSNGISALLSAQDRQAFLRGHNVQTKNTITQLFPFLVSHPFYIDDCSSPLRCAEERSRVFTGLVRHHVHVRFPLSFWDQEDWDELEVCHTCLVALKQTLQEARQKFWDELPGIYELPPWTDLEELRTAAIGDELALLT
ncbi:hypothetical protein C8R43DRAFT_1061459 [Mycena crocata]|nr:hypothetical protein C8R43DRAFT_1061459 [Mycena crocata]